MMQSTKIMQSTTGFCCKKQNNNWQIQEQRKSRKLENRENEGKRKPERYKLINATDLCLSQEPSEILTFLLTVMKCLLLFFIFFAVFSFL